MKGSKFVFDCVYLMYYRYQKKKKNPSRGGPYIHSPDCINKSNNKSRQ